MRLILMRHAKSDWSGPTEPDHARPLNARGRASARALGDWLRQGGFVPDRVLCSTSARTRETLDLLDLPDVPVRYEERLYHAAPETLWHSLSETAEPVVLMIGHNPGLALFAAQAVAQPPGHPRFADYPTCATLVADFEGPGWASVREHGGQTRAFVVPRDLIAT